MLKGMQEKEQNSSSLKNESWQLYILECQDGSFYTGIAKNLTHRFQQHQNGKASRYTRAHLPVRLVYEESGMTRTQALIRESTIKTLSRKEKEKLIETGDTVKYEKE